MFVVTAVEFGNAAITVAALADCACVSIGITGGVTLVNVFAGMKLFTVIVPDGFTVPGRIVPSVNVHVN